MTADAGDAPRARYDTEVTAVGEQVNLFLDEGIMVLFGEGAPEELAEFSVIHRPTVADGGPVPGGTVVIGDAELRVTAVGPVATENLLALGHLVLKRNGLDVAPLPGDVCCDEGPLPVIATGMRIRVVDA